MDGSTRQRASTQPVRHPRVQITAAKTRREVRRLIECEDGRTAHPTARRSARAICTTGSMRCASCHNDVPVATTPSTGLGRAISTPKATSAPASREVRCWRTKPTAPSIRSAGALSKLSSLARKTKSAEKAQKHRCQRRAGFVIERVCTALNAPSEAARRFGTAAPEGGSAVVGTRRQAAPCAIEVQRAALNHGGSPHPSRASHRPTAATFQAKLYDSLRGSVIVCQP